ncbi:unnamed protein product, partial [marine sediment metagenome]
MNYIDYKILKYNNMIFAGIPGYDIFYKERDFNIHNFSNSFNLPDKIFSILLSHEPPSPWFYEDHDCGSLMVKKFLEMHRFSLVVTGHIHVKKPRYDKTINLISVINPGANGVLININENIGEYKVLFEHRI